MIYNLLQELGKPKQKKSFLILKKIKMNFPNILSISRVLLLIPVVFFFEYELFLFSVLTFIVASLTDYFDGYFARKNNQTSDLGSLLDLLADKIFVSVLLIWMIFAFESLLILVSTILVVTREISVSYLRLFIISRSKEIKDTKADSIGKFKTTIQMIGLGFLLASPFLPEPLFILFLALIFFSALLSWYSFFRYLNKWNV
jgi:CDP-diacylglycerol--glycerol-3-phosphate 3-phosphatidyltransferase